MLKWMAFFYVLFRPRRLYTFHTVSSPFAVFYVISPKSSFSLMIFPDIVHEANLFCYSQHLHFSIKIIQEK